jgi:hypothetical protein
LFDRPKPTAGCSANGGGEEKLHISLILRMLFEKLLKSNNENEITVEN